MWKLNLYANAAFEIKDGDLVICQRNAMPDDLIEIGIRNARLLVAAPEFERAIESAIESIESTAERLQTTHALLARKLDDDGRRLRGILASTKEKA